MQPPRREIEFIEEVGLESLIKYIKYLEGIKYKYDKLNGRNNLLVYGEYFKGIYEDK